MSGECHKISLMIIQQWFRWWLDYLNQCWPTSSMPCDVTRPQWVNSLGIKLRSCGIEKLIKYRLWNIHQHNMTEPVNLWLIISRTYWSWQPFWHSVLWAHIPLHYCRAHLRSHLAMTSAEAHRPPQTGSLLLLPLLTPHLMCPSWSGGHASSCHSWCLRGMDSNRCPPILLIVISSLSLTVKKIDICFKHCNFSKSTNAEMPTFNFQNA